MRSPGLYPPSADPFLHTGAVLAYQGRGPEITRRASMSNRGFSHIGLSTLDLDKTRDFYERILGFTAVRCDIIKVQEGGRIRHVFFDTGRDQLIAFMEAKGVP